MGSKAFHDWLRDTLDLRCNVQNRNRYLPRGMEGHRVCDKNVQVSECRSCRKERRERVESGREVWGKGENKDRSCKDNLGDSRDLNSHEVPQLNCVCAVGKKRRNPGWCVRGARESWRRGGGERYITNCASIDYVESQAPGKRYLTAISLA